MTKKRLYKRFLSVFLYRKVKKYYKFHCVKPEFVIMLDIIYVIKTNKNCRVYVKLQRKGEIDNDPVKTVKVQSSD